MSTPAEDVQALRHPHPAPTSPTQFDTSDSEDVRALAATLLAAIQVPAYDDMTWAEVDAALRLTSHHTKRNWIITGTVKPPAPPA
jgi:hypothetical protein